MIQLPTKQANTLKFVFEEHFDDDEIYLDLVEIDEIFNVLIGGEISEDFYSRLDQTIQIDDYNLGFAVMIMEYIETIERESIQFQYFEICHNCKEFINKLEPLIKVNS